MEGAGASGGEVGWRRACRVIGSGTSVSTTLPGDYCTIDRQFVGDSLYALLYYAFGKGWLDPGLESGPRARCVPFVSGACCVLSIAQRAWGG